ncbi:Bug family tripartite tricarboxylate transporter substrate binding protein [Bordetella petrii]|uniref:Bug family tripartite tricarboxylate transporter substrate binding protein n=1 Tax=Bordetella petrii TaxID=94624 RepID=UPI001E5066EF|nr:tripartite tricarboxylate transporter substrate binding protein [Bordetella petrii]MCD0504319.1 tripartite tricarboxylate transporter substrate binding protein [Bordetella petrii]
MTFRFSAFALPLARRGLATLAATFLVAGTAAAQAWPSQPIKLIVPFPPGGPTDVASRLVSQQLEARLKQPVIVENRPGASGSIAANQLKRAPADGYTLMMLATPTLFAPFFYKNTGYETPKDFQAVATVYDLPIVVVVNPQKLPDVTTLQQLVDYAKAHPGELNYASSGAGSFGHMTMELLQDVGGFKMQHIAYKGGVPAITDTIGGQVPMMYADLVAALPHIKAGKLRALAVGSPERVSVLPDVPTIAEQGFKGFSAVSWGGLLAPKGTPGDVIARLNTELQAALADPEVQQKLISAGTIAHYEPAGQLTDRIASDYQKWGTLAREKGMTVD